MSKRATRKRARQAETRREFYARGGAKKPKHRDIWVEEYGKIPAGFEVHHINRDHYDNRLENLVALPQWYHVQIHQDMQRDRSLEFKYSLDYLLPKYYEFKVMYDEYSRRLAELNRELGKSLLPYKREATCTVHRKRESGNSVGAVSWKKKPAARILDTAAENDEIVQRAVVARQFSVPLPRAKVSRPPPVPFELSPECLAETARLLESFKNQRTCSNMNKDLTGV